MKRVLSVIMIIAMLLTAVPIAYAADALQLKLGDGSYEVKPGESFNVPLYLTTGESGEATCSNMELYITIPEGFDVTVTGGALTTEEITKVEEGIQLYVFNKAITTDASTPLCTLTYTAPSKEGTYTIELNENGLENGIYDANCDEIEYSVIKSTVTVKNDVTPVKTLESITVDPDEVTVPVDEQSDVLGYVKKSITVTANYNTGSEIVTDYDIVMSGEDKAIVTYGGKQATVTIKLDKPPVSDKLTLKLGNGSYEVKAGETFELPVYLTKGESDAAEFSNMELYITIPEGFDVTVTGGALTTEEITKVEEGIQLYVFNKAITTDASTPLCTLTYTAPSKEGTYTIELNENGLENGIYDANCDEIEYSVVKSTITVTGGSTPAKVLEDIEISYTDPIEIPYGADAEEIIRKAITVKAIYSNGDTDDNVTGYTVAIAENVATISYTVDGTTKSKTVNLKYQATPTLTVEIEDSVIIVPYGTENAKAYVEAAISGKVKLNETDLAPDDYVIEFNNGDEEATVKYAKDENIKTTVSVKYVELAKINVAIKDGGTEVKIPWNSTDDATAVKALIKVTAVFTNGAIDKEITDYTVDLGEGTFTVTYGGLTSDPIAYSKDAKPEAKVISIKAEPAELKVPYASTVSDEEIIKFVKENVKVTATYDDDSTGDVAEYDVTIADDKATIKYEDADTDVTLVKETRKLELSKAEITVPDGTNKDGIIAAFKASGITAKYVYSQDTAEQIIPMDDLTITVNDELTEVTVEIDGEKATIAVKIAVTPDFTENVKVESNAYGIADAKLVIFTDVKEGKVIKVTDEKGNYDATYMGNGKWAAVVTGAHTAEAVAGTPEAAKFGRLHDDSMVTAYDALITLLKANNNSVNAFDTNLQKYLLADFDGNGLLTADDALYINRISLGTAEDSTLWFNK